jgi:hypothetical protein
MGVHYFVDSTITTRSSNGNQMTEHCRTESQVVSFNALIQVAMSRGVTQLRPIARYRCFEGKCDLHLQGRRVSPKTEAARSFCSSVTSLFCPASYLEDGGSMFLKPVSNDIPDYIESHPRRL